MAVLKDYHCTKHGIFEAWEAVCPMKHCDGELSVVFLQPVGMKSDSTKKADASLQNLASDYQMNNVKSTAAGEHQTGYIARNNSPTPPAEPEHRPGNAAIWGQQGPFSMPHILKGGAFRSVAGESVGINPKDAGNLTGPRPSSVMQDHENLKIQP
jgi:hypothetical protein